jgi:hypothetical protein
MWHGSLFKQLPNTQNRGFPFPTHTHTHTQNKNKKKQLKLETSKEIFRKPKKGNKRKTIGKIEINKVSKNYEKNENKNNIKKEILKKETR